MTDRVDYGIDAPGVIRNLTLAGVAITVLALVGTLHLRGVTVVFPRLPTLIAAGVFYLEAGLMWHYARFGKFTQRERILAQVDWTRVRRALDIGTGRGLLLAAVAKRIPQGRADGIDVWHTVDLSGNNLANARRNLELEGVAGNTDLHSEDARRMSFPDATFDLAVSNLCLHNIHGKGERAKALAELARVLKPGGQAVLCDMLHLREYERELRRLGLKAHRTPFRPHQFPPLRMVIAEKPE